MAQHDYSIANQGFPATRADINNVLSAIATNNSGTSAPSTQYAGQFWIDTTSSTWTLYIHDGADDIQFATIDTSANTVNFIDSELGDNSVTTAKIADGNVTSAKLSYPLTTFSSTGIDDNATSTAITIDSSENVSFAGDITTGNNGSLFVLDSAGQKSAQLTNDDSTANSLQIDADPDNSGSGSYTAFRIDNSEKMRIDSSGNVGIGTSSPSYNFHIVGNNSGTVSGRIQNTNSNGLAVFGARNSDGFGCNYGIGSSGYTTIPLFTNRGFITAQATTDGLVLNTEDTDPIIFGISNSEKMRINSSGNVGIGTSSPAHGLHVVDNFAGNYASKIENNTSNGFITQMQLSAAPDNNSSAFLVCADPANRCIIWSDGDLDNHDNSYGSLSDERIKQDIRDSNSQWNDIKNIRVRNFKKKDDVRQYGENAWEQIGVISQELETVSPKLIKHVEPTPSDILSDSSFGTLYQEGDEIPEGKNVGDVKEVHEQVKKVSYSVLYMKSIKALQEAMERIETLEAKVQTLENNNP